MESINNEQFQQKFASALGQQKRYESYIRNLRADRSDCVFDGRIYEVAARYCRSIAQLEEIRAYLNRIVDEDGNHFSRSLKFYSEMEAAVVDYFEAPEKDSFGWNRNYQQAVEIVKARYAVAKLKPRVYHSKDDILAEIEDSHTSAGIEKIVRGVSHKCDFPEDQLYSWYLEKTEAALRDGSYNDPALATHRSQGSGEFTDEGEETGTWSHKTRIVWIMAMSNVLSEIRYSHPLNNWMVNYNHSAIAKSDADISRFVSYARLKYGRWVSLDYSKYDAMIPSWLIESAFEVLASAFNMDETETKLLKVLENDFIHTNIVLADGIHHVDHGDPSGSGLTAVINGICNEIMTETWALAMNVKLGDYMIMGDDNLIFIESGNVDVKDIASYIKHNFGISVNTKSDEGTSDKPPKFLSRSWRYDGAWRHPKILVSKMLYPEQFREYGDVTPELVFYSYILGYPAGMKEFFDVERFLRDYPRLGRRTVLSNVALKSLPYNVRLKMMTDKFVS